MMMWRRSGAGMHLLPYMIFIAQEIIWKNYTLKW
jgi:hypothetical protein